MSNFGSKEAYPFILFERSASPFPTLSFLTHSCPTWPEQELLNYGSLKSAQITTNVATCIKFNLWISFALSRLGMLNFIQSFIFPLDKLVSSFIHFDCSIFVMRELDDVSVWLLLVGFGAIFSHVSVTAPSHKIKNNLAPNH